ncbi:MAG: gluconeogenesis factor YvcK family protein [Parcubacteria group bacterium]|jgi:uncharacterized cofD-like protein
MRKINIVNIGGGTGRFTLLSGLKKYPANISAIVSMADDGGSTGKLRDELGVLPPGDVRQCLVALSDSSETLRELMNYRFERGNLKGHSFGNLLLSALEKITGDFTKGVGEAARILNVKGEVIPVTGEDMRIDIRLKNGEILKGENELDDNPKIKKIGVEEVYPRKNVKADKRALEKIRSADLIVIGPGDLFASVIPNFLIKEISDAIKKSKCKTVFNCNLTNKKGLTEGFSLEDYIRMIEKYIGKGRVDYVTFNSKMPSRDLIKKYERKEGKGAIVGLAKNKSNKRSYKVIRADLLQTAKVTPNKNDAIGATRSFIRHDSEKLARVIMAIVKLKK